jgi:ElaB/YqjD/DUF883 family membrane-anchored ribosome-binding protein
MNKPTSFDEAFQILDRAINDISEPNLRPLVDGEIRHIKSDVRDNVHDRAVAVRQLAETGWEHVGELAEQVDVDVRRNPLLYIGGAAAAALLIGIIVAPRARTQSQVTEVYV